MVAVVESAELRLGGDAGCLERGQIGLRCRGREICGVQVRAPGAGAAGGIVQDGVEFVPQPIAEGQVGPQFEPILCEEIVAGGPIAAPGVAVELERRAGQAFGEVHQRIRNSFADSSEPVKPSWPLK